MKLAPHQFQRARPPLRQPAGFRRDRRPLAPGDAGPRHRLSRPHRRRRWRICPARIWRPRKARRPTPHCCRTSPPARPCWKSFSAADIVVLGAPMYNFTIPSQLKAWIDRIVVAGKTFKYGANGAEGLAGNKRVIIAISRGGFYGADTPMAVARAPRNLSALGVRLHRRHEPRIHFRRRHQVGPEHREKALAGALQAATNLHAA